jgi:hypothetical protein
MGDTLDHLPPHSGFDSLRRDARGYYCPDCGWRNVNDDPEFFERLVAAASKLAKGGNVNNRVTGTILASVVVLGASIVAGAWLVSQALDRNAQASRAVAVIEFCGRVSPANRAEAVDCELFGRQLRLHAWGDDLLPAPDADAVGRGEDHNQ